ncbi:UDP-2,3-diacylglucosamine diphosphatase [Simplicispira psychrophila]|uniref:UDP-2,3-diacylglucosamine diphosphatase n=1 Tax=Simplicispira psychrophila TaxID=80882 RepID=UPI00047F74CD|nr:UDP-2,3-diacylglucosamine diphosphatase [Simplicispira psychrophila]
MTTVPRCAQLIAAPHWRTVDFLSDLHLQASDRTTFGAWQRYLAQTPADAVFLLGDLFEVWVGDDALDEPGSFEAECCAVLHAAAQHRALFVLPGNRDFLLGDAFLQRSSVTGLNDPTVLDFAGQRWLLSHGDALCLDDLPYQRFRAVARSAAWQQQFLAQPLAVRRAQARDIRNQSEARKDAGEVYADVDTAAACTWLRSAQAHTLIHGHTHRPGEHMLAEGLMRCVLSDWDAAAQPPRADILRLTASGLQRLAPDGW